MKKKSILLLFTVIIFMSLSSCDLLKENVSEEEIVEGLKTALKIGTDTACTDLNKKDGYYKNDLIKILLPPQADVIFEAMKKPQFQSLGLDVVLQTKIDSVVLAINRAAEDVADDAKPIFVDAITNLSISEGLNILQGENVTNSSDASTFDSLAASHFMEYVTRDALFSLYQPKIDEALNKDLGLGFSANEAWNTLLWSYNNYITMLGNGYEPVEDVNLSSYSTDKGLDGLFMLIENQEKEIRNNPYKWGSDIIEKVFGYVYEE